MVAAEAAAAGCPPVVADHSGLATIARGLEEDYPVALRHLASFPTGDAVELRRRLEEIISLSQEDRAALRAAASKAAQERWSWASVGHRLLEACGA